MNLKQLKRHEDTLDKRIAQYLAELDEADKADRTTWSLLSLSIVAAPQKITKKWRKPSARKAANLK